MTISFKKKTALYLFSILAVFLFSFQTAFSQANLEVQFESAPLFSEIDFLPGQSISRWIKATNNTSSEQRIAAEAINYPGFPNPNNIPANDLSRALNFIISEQGGSDIFGGAAGSKTLFDFYSVGETFLSLIPAQSSKTYNFKIDFSAAKANEWQAKTTSFDILVGFEGLEGGGEQGGTSGGDSGGGGGGGLPLGLTIQGESVQAVEIGETNVVIRWTTSYFSTSQVLYDTVPSQFDLSIGAPNFGYAYYKAGDDSGLEKVTGHTVTLSGLAPGTTYYYRTVSYASPATISREYSFRTKTSETENIPQGEQGGGPVAEDTGKESGKADKQLQTSQQFEKKKSGAVAVKSGEVGARVAGVAEKNEAEEVLTATDTNKNLSDGAFISRAKEQTEGKTSRSQGAKLSWSTLLIGAVDMLLFAAIVIGAKQRRRGKED